jgi:hypothetical protein
MTASGVSRLAIVSAAVLFQEKDLYNLEDIVELSDISVTLTLGEIYRRVSIIPYVLARQ